jgi:hypothetical protein
MPQTHDNSFICFVQGHGATASFGLAASGARAIGTKPQAKVVTPLASAQERAKTRAAAQLAMQRVSILRIEKK